MFTSVKSTWGAVGVMLALIALYLLLEHAGGASQIMGSLSGFGVNMGRMLQGR